MNDAATSATRRQLLQRGGMVAAGAWAAPAVLRSGVAAAVGSDAPAGPKIGNDTEQRLRIDSFQNFVLVDTNNPSSISGWITEFQYRAGAGIDVAGRAFKFLVVSPAGVVTWKSDLIEVPANGVYTYVPSSAPAIEPGDNVGFWVRNQGVIAWDYDVAGAPASYTANNSGEPTVGNALSYAGASERFYSFLACTAG